MECHFPFRPGRLGTRYGIRTTLSRSTPPLTVTGRPGLHVHVRPWRPSPAIRPMQMPVAIFDEPRSGPFRWRWRSKTFDPQRLDKPVPRHSAGSPDPRPQFALDLRAAASSRSTSSRPYRVRSTASSRNRSRSSAVGGPPALPFFGFSARASRFRARSRSICAPMFGDLLLAGLRDPVDPADHAHAFDYRHFDSSSSLTSIRASFA